MNNELFQLVEMTHALFPEEIMAHTQVKESAVCGLFNKLSYFLEHINVENILNIMELLI